eukprot:15154417-Ditylum_brightwellii.AAC.2
MKPTANELEITDDSTTTITNTASEDQDSILNNSNEASCSAQQAFPNKEISCHEGDKVKIIDLNNIFRVLSNNVNGLVTAHEGGELLEELTVLKELNLWLLVCRRPTKIGNGVAHITKSRQYSTSSGEETNWSHQTL